MLTIANGNLAVEVLDPANSADRERLGTRYCWGGYVWQVRDAAVGPLLAGAQWPDPRPTPFNGQGIPESFRYEALGDKRPLTATAGRGFILGVGEVAPTAGGAPSVIGPIGWDVTRTDRSASFRARHRSHGWNCAVMRTLSLDGRTLVSATEVSNDSDRPLPLHWFAHPFFPLTGGRLTCDLPRGYACAENPGFVIDASGRLSFRRPFHGIDDGRFEPLQVPAGQPLVATVSHPTLEFIRFSTDFTPDHCPVWGNGNTWSIEPYILTTLAPGERRSWELKYVFGERKGDRQHSSLRK